MKVGCAAPVGGRRAAGGSTMLWLQQDTPVPVRLSTAHDSPHASPAAHPPTLVSQEALKDARCANADMDDDALSAGRAAARLRHALEESQGALREAQGALAQVRGWLVEGGKEGSGMLLTAVCPVRNRFKEQKQASHTQPCLIGLTLPRRSASGARRRSGRPRRRRRWQARLRAAATAWRARRLSWRRRWSRSRSWWRRCRCAGRLAKQLHIQLAMLYPLRCVCGARPPTLACLHPTAAAAAPGGERLVERQAHGSPRVPRGRGGGAAPGPSRGGRGAGAARGRHASKCWAGRQGRLP